jgi:Protein of unknown function (DUF1071)
MSNQIFQKLSAVDISKQVETKNGLKYLSWSFAWSHIKINYPDANYKVIHFDNKPYLFDENLGYLVATEVSIAGETILMQLPVMDGANKAQKHIAYTYKAKAIEKTVEPATMFDINTAIMRCLVKNLAMFGLGISLYSGEDLPAPQPIPKSKGEEALEDLILKLEKNEIKDFEKIRVWLLENQSKLPSELLNKATDLINEKQNKVVNIEPNLDEITDEVLASFDPNYVN